MRRFSDRGNIPARVRAADEEACSPAGLNGFHSPAKAVDGFSHADDETDLVTVTRLADRKSVV